MKQYFRAIPIFGFAYGRSKIAEDLEANVRSIIRHLIKLWRYPYSDSVNHWRQEVYEFLYEVGRLKGSNKYPSSNFIMKNTYEVNKSDISKWFNGVSRVYDSKFKATSIRNDVDLMGTRIKEYFEWLAATLSVDGYVFPEDVYAKLKELEFGNT